MSRRRRIVVFATLIAAILGICTDQWFVRPQVDPPGTADVIFVLGGGGERVKAGVQLARDGVAGEVVFASIFVEDQRVWSARPCNSKRPDNLADDVILRCVQPDPRTTRGEARALRAEAAEHGWTQIVVVASTDQVTRARRLIERCWSGDLRMVGVDHDQPWPVRAVYEWGASAKATILRAC